MGYAGATYLVQEVCNAMFDALFNILPLASALDKVEATPARGEREVAWDDAAKTAGAATPSLAHFVAIMEAAARRA